MNAPSAWRGRERPRDGIFVLLLGVALTLGVSLMAVSFIATSFERVGHEIVADAK